LVDDHKVNAVQILDAVTSVTEDVVVSRTPTPTRRERLREALTAEIKECACRQLADGGPPAVTLRGIARELGVSPAALYGYFDSLDALFTALIVDGFDDLADAVAAAASGPGTPGLRLLESVRAFRRWALEHPERFRLLYFSPVPGYEAPADGETLTASLRVFVPMLAIIIDGWADGTLPEPPPGPTIDTSKFREAFGLEITSDQLRMTTECWAEFHGLVALEVNGHLVERWVEPAALFDANMIAALHRLGFTDVD
jgi:AcrR family transcriptional regulator